MGEISGEFFQKNLNFFPKNKEDQRRFNKNASYREHSIYNSKITVIKISC